MKLRVHRRTEKGELEPGEWIEGPPGKRDYRRPGPAVRIPDPSTPPKPHLDLPRCIISWWFYGLFGLLLTLGFDMRLPWIGATANLFVKGLLVSGVLRYAYREGQINGIRESRRAWKEDPP